MVLKIHIKKIIVDFRRTRKTTHASFHMSGEKCVEDIKFLGISKDQTWQVKLPSQLLANFYRNTTQSVPETVPQCGTPAALLRTGRIWSGSLSLLRGLWEKCSQLWTLQKKATNIHKDPKHPGHTFFVLLPSGKRYTAKTTHANRVRNSVFLLMVQQPHLQKTKTL